MKKHFNHFIFAGALLLTSNHARAEKHFVQDDFAIGLWVAPPATKDYYQDLAAANFNLVIGGNADLSKKFGLHTVAAVSGPMDQWPQNSAVWGYMLVDEPGAGGFPDLAKQCEEIRRTKPGAFGYINLLPNYAPASALGTSNYDTYIAQFITTVKPEVLSMDSYPLMRPDGDSRANYRENLEQFRQHSAAAGIPFWNYFYAMPFNDHLDPTEAQIRWQIYTSIGFGAKGVMYFCYFTPGKGAKGAGEFPKGGAIITAEGLKTRHYDEARRINAELKNLGPTLMKLTGTGAVLVNVKTNVSFPEGRAVRKLSNIPGDPPVDCLVGSFQQPDGSKAVLLLNDSYSQTAWLTVDFAVDASQVMEVSKADGKARPVVDDSPELKGLQLSFGAGDGRLFLLPKGK